MLADLKAESLKSKSKSERGLLEKVGEYNYLGHELESNKEHEGEIKRHINTTRN